MNYKVFYKCDYSKNIKILYFIDNTSEPQSKPMFLNNEGLHEVEVDCENELIYKFLINDKCYINDSKAVNYVYKKNYGYWSIIHNKQLVNNKNVPELNKILICKDINNCFNPLHVTKSINSMDNNIICWTELTNITEDVLVTMVWKDPKEDVFTTVDLNIKYDKRSTRIAYTGINIKDIINSNIFEKGKWEVALYLNGTYIENVFFEIIKYQNYNRNGYVATKANSFITQHIV